MKAVLGLVVASVAACLFGGTTPLPIDSGCLLLRFDDRNFDSWEEALPLFARYDAHATFFVYGAIDALLLSRFDRIAGGGFWTEAKAGRIDRCDDLFVPTAEAAGLRVCGLDELPFDGARLSREF